MYNKNNPLKVFTSFSGYDSQCMALEVVKEKHPDFDYELVGWSEIDAFAIRAHNACFPQWKDRNYGDICKIDWANVPDFDFFTFSSPCQDLSAAGLQRGLEEGSGTRSSLLWECRKAIITKKPKYLMFENVSAIVSQKFLPHLKRWLDELSGYGYTHYLAPSMPRPAVTGKQIRSTKKYCLNTKDYGVPQNRERVIIFSILNGGQKEFLYPRPMKLQVFLEDVLEEVVPEKYYLSEKQVKGFFAKGNENDSKGGR